jgi:CBS domain-containing protein
MKASDIMTQPAITAREDATLEQIARTMMEHRIGGVPIVDSNGGLCGILTESDFTEKERFVPFSMFRAPQLFGEWFSPEGIDRVYRAARQIAAREVMTRPVITAAESASIHEIMTQMVRHEVHRIPILRDGRPVGIVTRHDLLKMMLGNSNGGDSSKVSV